MPEDQERQALIEEIERKRLIQQIEQARAAQAAPQVAEPGLGAQMQAGLEAFGKAATFGQLPKMQAGLQQLIPEDEATQRLREQGFNIQGPTFEQVVAAQEARQAQQAEQFPITTGIGTGAGLLAGGGAAGAGLRAVGRAALPRAAAALGTAAEGGGAAGLGARALTTGAESAGLAAIEPTLEGDLPGAVQAAQEGGVIGAAFPVAGAALRKVPGLGKKAISAATGVSEEAQSKYLANADRIKKATLDEVSEAATKSVQRIKDAASKSKLDTVDQIQLALQGGKQKVIQASQEAFDILDNANLRVDKGKLIRTLEDQKKALSGAGQVGPSNAQARKALDNLIGDLQTQPDTFTGPDVKRLLQSLDDSIGELNTATGGFTGTTERALVNARRAIDQGILKNQVPAYAEKMKEVANLTEFQKIASKELGKPEKAYNALSRLEKPGREIKDETLKRLAQSEGVDLTRFRRAQEAADVVKTFNEANMKDKIKSLVSGRSEQIKQAFQKVSELSDDDFIQMADDLAINNEFEREFIRGSRNVNLWGLIGAAASENRLAGVGLLTGGAAGAMIGSVLDKFGPKIAKKMLEQVAAVKGTPTVSKIRAMQLPQRAIKFLEDDFRRAYLVSQSDEPVPVPPSQRPVLKRDISASDSLSPVDKAKMVSRINSHGELPMPSKLLSDGGKYEAPQPNLTDETKKPQQPARSIRDIADFAKLRRPKEF